MKTQLRFSIGLVKPVKCIVSRRQIKATDRAWKEAIFGLGGSSKRIAGAQIGTVDMQPLAVIAELPDAVADGTPIWTIQTDTGLYAFAGPAAVYNDAGFGPATLGIPIERLREIITFNPDPDAIQDGLRRTIKSRSRDDATDPV